MRQAIVERMLTQDLCMLLSLKLGPLRGKLGKQLGLTAKQLPSEIPKPCAVAHGIFAGKRKRHSFENMVEKLVDVTGCGPVELFSAFHDDIMIAALVHLDVRVCRIPRATIGREQGFRSADLSCQLINFRLNFAGRIHLLPVGSSQIFRDDIFSPFSSMATNF
jgi:hypothetical protein